MNLRDAMRSADPAERLAHAALDARDEQLLRQILDPAGAAPGAASSTARPAERSRRDRRTVVVTAIVAAAVAVAAVVAIRSVSTTTTSPAPAVSGSTDTVRRGLEDAVFAELDEVATGDLPVRRKSALTWTDESPDGSGDGIDLSGKDLFIAAACEGGGSIAVQVTGRPDATLDCTSPSTLSPIDLTAGAVGDRAAAGLQVVVTSGRPHYVVKAMAFETAARAE